MHQANYLLNHINNLISPKQVYGITHAKVSIGYHYTNCPRIMWEIHAATMKGFEVDTSDIGGWSLDIHHHYNFHEGEYAEKHISGYN